MRILAFVLSALLTGSPLIAGTKLKLHKISGIPGEYMVVLLRGETPNDVPKLAKELGKEYGVEIGFTWNNALDGFTCRGTDESIQALAEDPLVAFVEQNFTMDSVRLSGTQWTADLYNNYLWHLDRIDELYWSQADGKHNMCTEGRGTVAYVIDTGVRVDHEQFEVPSRVVVSRNFSADRIDMVSTNEADATNACMTIVQGVNDQAKPERWHGTAVASVLGGTQVGVAKPQIVSLRVARCSDGEIEALNVINAVDWIGGANDPYGTYPGVVNHSGYLPPWHGSWATYNTAISGSVDRHGKPYFTSADNYSSSSCNFAPDNLARTYYQPGGKVFVVGGSMIKDSYDYRWQEFAGTIAWSGDGSGSNSGACVSIYAPADRIRAARSALPSGSTAYDSASGTSFASPIVAGIAARYMERQRIQTGVTPTASQVYTWLLNGAGAMVFGDVTPEYYICGALLQPWFDPSRNQWRVDKSWLAGEARPAYCLSSPGEVPSWSGVGKNASGSWERGAPPAHFPSVSNLTGARMVYWDEGPCAIDWTVP